MALYAVILAGGSGTRFWPASRRSRPKQLLGLSPGSETSLIAAAVRRARAFCPPERILVATGAHLVDAIRCALPELGSDSVLGDGCRDDLRDVVYVRPEAFAPAETTAIARELERIDRVLVDSGRPYLLIGFGRWGTSDERAGIPVAWGQISGARVIVEATLPGVSPELSQGSHFFHNLLAFQVMYLSVLHDGPFRIDFEWLDRQLAEAESERVRHVHLSRPLDVRVDGRRRLGVVRHHG